MDSINERILKINDQNFFLRQVNKKWIKNKISFSVFESRFRERYLNEQAGLKSIFEKNSLEKHVIDHKEYFIKKYELIDYYIEENDEKQNDLFIRVIQSQAGTLQHEFYEHILLKFLDIERIKNYINMLGIKRPDHLFRIAKSMNKVLYDMLKEYMIELIDFYYRFTGLQFPLEVTPPDMLFNPFFKFYKKSINIPCYDNTRNKLMYLDIVSDRIRNRDLDLSKKLINEIIESLSKIKNDEKEELSVKAKDIRYKLYTYTGFKCPEHLIYASTLEYNLAQKLAKYTIGKFFEKGTDHFVLSLLFKGRNGIVTEDKAKLDFYKTNQFISAPIIIKFKQLGYVAYIYSFLSKKGFIKHDHLWESIARHKCFKIKMQNGTSRYITNKDLASSLKYKTALIKKKTPKRNYKIDKLDKFLNKLIKKKCSLHHNS